jgi:hypothetical protein
MSPSEVLLILLAATPRPDGDLMCEYDAGDRRVDLICYTALGCGECPSDLWVSPEALPPKQSKAITHWYIAK